MRKNLGHSLLALLLAVVLGTGLVMGADAAINARSSRRQKNVLPVGWMYDMKYTVWRTRNGLAATPQTWKKYARERDRFTRQDRGIYSPLLDTLDGAVEDFSELLEGRAQ